MQKLPARRLAVDSFVVFDAILFWFTAVIQVGCYMVFPAGLNKFGIPCF